MFPLEFKRLVKFLIIFITTGTLVFGFFCIGIFSEHAIHTIMAESTLSISVASAQECCGSSVLHHFDTWKNIALAVPNKIHNNVMLLILELTLTGGSLFLLRQRYPLQNINILRLTFYIRQRFDLFLLNYLKIAFARGILNPKTY